ncbi:MAG: hypothetical protein PHV83_04010 [Bacteroidales bacterium]|nr:hypothetical protein [Bacteroidales bacterium]
MRQISFSLTTEAFISGKKDVTRRIGWTPERAPKGTHLMAVNKCQGLKKGEQIKYGEIEIVSNTPEPLSEIIYHPVRTDQVVHGWMENTEMTREGFPAWATNPRAFVEFFCKANHCQPDQIVNRIVFRRVA